MPYHPVVVRWVSPGARLLGQRLEQVLPGATYRLAGKGRLCVVRQFARGGCDTVPTWTAPGRLYGAGRLLRSTRITMRVTAWPGTTGMVQLYPASRHLRRWSASRRARYFDLAHRATDTMAAILAA